MQQYDYNKKKKYNKHSFYPIFYKLKLENKIVNYENKTKINVHFKYVFLFFLFSLK